MRATAYRQAVFFDLDSTVCDTRQRHHMIPTDPAERDNMDWVAYSMACAGDDPVPATFALARLLAPYYWIVVLSGRNEAARDLTVEWLDEHGFPYDDIILRPDNSTENNGAYKKRMIDSYCNEEGLFPGLMVEDWPPVADALDGVCPTLLVRPPGSGSEFAKMGADSSADAEANSDDEVLAI